MNEMYKYLEEHNYISKNENKDPLRQQELSTTRAECIANKYDSLTDKLQQENKQLKETLDKYENPKDMTLMMMWCTEKIKDENKKLKDNWNMLKEWLYEDHYLYVPEIAINSTYQVVLNKMQELEQGSDE